MLFPVIKVKDNYNGAEHIVGINSHDSLYIDHETGGIHYLNLQCCSGTRKFEGKSDYEFVGKEFEYSGEPVIEFLTFNELAELCIKQTKMSCENEKKLRAIVKKVFNEREKAINENGLNEGDDIRRSGGILI